MEPAASWMRGGLRREVEGSGVGVGEAGKGSARLSEARSQGPRDHVGGRAGGGEISLARKKSCQGCDYHHDLPVRNLGVTACEDTFCRWTRLFTIAPSLSTAEAEESPESGRWFALLGVAEPGGLGSLPMYTGPHSGGSCPHPRQPPWAARRGPGLLAPGPDVCAGVSCPRGAGSSPVRPLSRI